MVELFELLMVQIELSNIQIKKFFDYEPVTSLSIPPLDHIFAVSVIYQVIEEQPEYPEEYPHSAVQQSIASKDQKGKRRKQPDAMFLVAEKPSLAESISKILAPNGQCNTRKSITPVHEYTSEFHGKKSKFKFTSVKGHVYGLDFTQTHNNWNIDPLTLFTAPTMRSETDGKICKHLNNESKNIDYLVLWLDCDREGENICFEVIDNVIHNMKSSIDGKTKNQRILRAKFSAITYEDIHKAMNNLGYPNKNEALELDLKIGCAFTRFQTKFFNEKYGNLDSRVISYGPCQTPTLSFCVSRHDQIQHFIPEKYWTLSLTISKDNANISLKWKRSRIFDRKIANLFLKMIEENSKDIKVTAITSEIKTKYRPVALNTVELLKFGSSNLGISPHEMMSHAEKLYMQGYISYPRTETTSYPRNFDLISVLKTQVNSTTWGAYAKELTPMKLANEGDLHGDLWRVYSFITKYFLGSISKNIKLKENTILIKIANESFEITGAKVIEPGFSKIMHWRKLPNDENLPDFRKGENLNLVNYKLTEGLTSPPDYFTESEVIGLMEKHGIGTDASIPTHINNICQRNYATVKGNDRKIDPDLSLPTMRSDIEKQLNYIASGKAEFSKFLEYFLKLFAEKFKYFGEKIDLMDELFEANFSPLASVGKIYEIYSNEVSGLITKILRDQYHYGITNNIIYRPQRLHCSVCNETYSLPQNGNIKMEKPPSYVPTVTVIHHLRMLKKGKLILDQTSSTNSFKLYCTICKSIVKFKDTVKGVSVKKNESCKKEDCEVNVIKIQLKENSPTVEGCVLCDEEVIALLENRFSRGGRSRGNKRFHRGGGRKRRGNNSR
ncbi:1164_t:CDS:10 [Entrophospora sp. SA101]|nr:1164_t:CDS:10 [Entrophospora sp. SA101]